MDDTVFEPVYPRVIYKPLNIQVEIREVSYLDDGTVRSYCIYTLDGSAPFSWQSYTGGEGYTTKHSPWAWVMKDDLTTRDTCKHPEGRREVRTAITESQIGYDADGIIYSGAVDHYERCGICHTVTKEHVLIDEEKI